VRPYATLASVGLLLVAASVLIGGKGAGIGGAFAVIAQTAAVALLRPAIAAPQPVFMGRWLGGVAIRALVLSALLAISATNQQTIPVLPAALGYLGVLLPLLFTETRFLR
jgi:hypothetical protein